MGSDPGTVKDAFGTSDGLGEGLGEAEGCLESKFRLVDEDGGEEGSGVEALDEIDPDVVVTTVGRAGGGVLEPVGDSFSSIFGWILRADLHAE